MISLGPTTATNMVPSVHNIRRLYLLFRQQDSRPSGTTCLTCCRKIKARNNVVRAQQRQLSLEICAEAHVRQKKCSGVGHKASPPPICLITQRIICAQGIYHSSREDVFFSTICSGASRPSLARTKQSRSSLLILFESCVTVATCVVKPWHVLVVLEHHAV